MHCADCEDGGLMEVSEVRRMIRLTNEETKLLVSLINQRKEILESKKTDAVTNDRKAKSWKEVEAEFNAKDFVRKRTVKQLRKSWENVKMKKRKAIDHERQERKRTGGGPMPSSSTAEELPPEVEIALPSVSYIPLNAWDSDTLGQPSSSPVDDEGTSECLLPLESVEECEHTRETNTPGVGQKSKIPFLKRSASITREVFIEKEMEDGLQNEASFYEKEREIQKLRMREAEIAIAVKEQELTNAKATSEIIQMEAEFKKRILEVQLQAEEAKLQQRFQDAPP